MTTKTSYGNFELFFFVFVPYWYSKKTICLSAISGPETLSAENQNEGKNKLYNHTKLAIYVFLCLYFFPLSIKVNVIATQMK